ncbi:hypothetical protein Tco_0890891 [Tanacetum coccineum]|uniref:Xylulose kinase-1 n=1 Tax=Tanacetum coccineum TaxID=301880 RepID=A0ABQ5C6V7_9ASTR
MVTCLEKTEGNSEFHEIVDFLTSSSIHALTVSPTIYTSYIKQFWNTAISQTVNDEKQIHATVDSKAVVVTEASIRGSLLLNDADGTACLTNEAIFQNLALMGKGLKFSRKVTPLFPNMLTQVVVDEGEGLEQPTEPQPTPFPTQPSTEDQPPITESSSRPEHTHSPSLNLEGTGRTEGNQELLYLCTNLSNRVLTLETAKDAQVAEIIKLKTRIKKLKQKSKPVISYHRAWLKSVKRLSMKKRFGIKQSVSKQGRINVKPGSTLDAFDDLDAVETEDVVKEGRQSNETEKLKLTADTKEIDEDKGSGEKRGSTEELVSTAIPEIVSTARPDVDAARQKVSNVEPRTPPITTSIFDDEDITMAQTLIKMKEEKANEKGVSIKDIEDSLIPARSVLTLKLLSTINPKDKGKGVLKEPEPTKKMTKSDFDAAQIDRDAEMYDEVQAGIDVDALFVAKLQQEEREEYTLEDRAKFLAETIAVQRKFRAAQRSTEIRSRLPTKSQLRNLMMTYLKNMDDAVKDTKDAASVDKEKTLEEPDNNKVEVKLEEAEQGTMKTSGKTVKMKARKKVRKQTHASTDDEQCSEDDERNKKDAITPRVLGSLTMSINPLSIFSIVRVCF